jgi:hypothetical protein
MFIRFYVLKEIHLRFSYSISRVRLYHSAGLDILLNYCLEPPVVGYTDPRKIASALLLNLIATHRMARSDAMEENRLNLVKKLLEGTLHHSWPLCLVHPFVSL